MIYSFFNIVTNESSFIHLRQRRFNCFSRWEKKKNSCAQHYHFSDLYFGIWTKVKKTWKAEARLNLSKFEPGFIPWQCQISQAEQHVILVKLGLPILPYLAYTFSDFHLFPKLKEHLRSITFKCRDADCYEAVVPQELSFFRQDTAIKSLLVKMLVYHWWLWKMNMSLDYVEDIPRYVFIVYSFRLQ